jgi:hypothetical protein
VYPSFQIRAQSKSGARRPLAVLVGREPTVADAKGIGAAFRSFMRKEQDVEERTLRLRTTTNKLKATRVPSRFLASQLLSCAVFFVATDIFDVDWSIMHLETRILFSLD